MAVAKNTLWFKWLMFHSQQRRKNSPPFWVSCSSDWLPSLNKVPSARCSKLSRAEDSFFSSLIMECSEQGNILTLMRNKHHEVMQLLTLLPELQFGNLNSAVIAPGEIPLPSLYLSIKYLHFRFKSQTFFNTSENLGNYLIIERNIILQRTL